VPSVRGTDRTRTGSPGTPHAEHELPAAGEQRLHAAAHLDFPIGCPEGKPNEPEQQREILRAALREAPPFSEPWRIHELPFQWSPDGSRDWEEIVKDLYRKGVETVAAHRARGESLAGREREFAIRCNC